MELNKYQKEAHKTADYPNFIINYVYLALALNGESGEVAEKVKKIIRNKNGDISPEDKAEIAKEIGDVLWCISELSLVLDYPLEEIAQINLSKINDRKKRGVIKSSGDNR